MCVGGGGGGGGGWAQKNKFVVCFVIILLPESTFATCTLISTPTSHGTV